MTLNTASQRLYSVDEVADLFGVRPGTVTRWLRIGRLGGIKIPDAEGQWRIRAEDLDFVLQGQDVPQ